MKLQTNVAPLSQATRAFLAKQHAHLIGDAWKASLSGETTEVFNPATGEVIARVPRGGREDIDAAVQCARRAFDHGEWRGLKPNVRVKLLHRLADLVDRHAAELSELDSFNNGMPIRFASGVFTPGASDSLRFAAGWIGRIDGETHTLSLPGEWHAYTQREPIGVCGLILPWNVPLSNVVGKCAPGLAAGCTIVVKPAEETPLSALRFGELVLEAGIPPGVVNIVAGDGVHAGAALSEHPDVDFINFTGSTVVGRLVAQAATMNLKKVALELGGKSPVFVFGDADLDAAIAGAANAIFLNSGQVCSAGSRLYVARSIYDKVVQGVADFARGLRMGHGLDPETVIGPLVSARQHQRVTSYIRQGVGDGAEVVAGGEASATGSGFFVEPTVLARTHRDMSVRREEIFGPVVCAMPFEDEALEALAREANDTRYGLGASIWTSNLSIAHRLASRIRAGTVWINAHNSLDPTMPWGGYKESGWGRGRGYSAIEGVTELKSVMARIA